MENLIKLKTSMGSMIDQLNENQLKYTYDVRYLLINYGMLRTEMPDIKNIPVILTVLFVCLFMMRSYCQIRVIRVFHSVHDIIN